MENNNESTNFETYLKERSKYIDEIIKTYLSKESSDKYIYKLLGRSGYEYDHDAINKGILEPAWYLLSMGGKRWRPTLMLLIIEALGKDPNEFIEFSLIPEIIHNSTLVHDDIEDNSSVRRGMPAVHTKHGVDIALNLGDWLYFFPIVTLIDSPKLSKYTKDKLLSIYVREMLRVSTGQAIDIVWHNHLVDPLKITESNYLQMVYSKTGVLARMASEMGATLADADEKTIEALGNLGATIGVAFQIEDDILNIVPSKLADNKGGVGDDISEGKLTLMVIYALRHLDVKKRDRLLNILKMHTQDKALINEAIALINEAGAVEYAKSEAKRIMNEAWDNVDKLLKPSPAKEKIKELTQFLINRNI
ncbi:MAG: polyprenyl synthetase family protein [Candidatus Micrarchaeia archaeon]